MNLQEQEMGVQQQPMEVEQPEVEVSLSTKADIERWLGRIASAKTKWKPDFERMERNMEFVAGLQWSGQTGMDDDRYINNIVLRMVNQKVATLYAKNPTAVAERRKRMDYQIWDGDMQSLQMAIAQAQQIVQSGQVLPPQIAALFEDFQNGKQHEKMVQKVCDTLEIVYQYQVDSQRPEFKEQVKQAVRRGVICGVAFGRPMFCRDGLGYANLSSVDAKSGMAERVKRAKEIVDQLSEGDIDKNSAQVETLRSLALSLGAGADQNTTLAERLEFDFPLATSVIVDERCRSLKEFVSARWLAQEYVLPVEEVNALFGVDISVGGGGSDNAVEHAVKNAIAAGGTSEDPLVKGLVTLYEVFDYNTKTRFFLCEGWKEYVLAPEPVIPLGGFWHHFALTFNDVEASPDTKCSIYPPSDVQLLKAPQMEWNRTRNALRDQRNANAPKYVTRKGLLTEADKDKLRNALPNSVIELEGVPPEVPPDKMIAVMQVAAIDPQVYNTQPLEQDMMYSGGMQAANVGPAQPNVTATVGSIAEQSRMTVTASNIDDLDGWLSRLADAGGEMLLREMGVETVKRIAGIGAVWPQQTKEDFVNEVNLKIKAASSGRPNKALDIANIRDVAPLLLQAGANPVGIVEEIVRRLDDGLDVSKFFPLAMPQMQQGAAPEQGAEAQQQPMETSQPQQPNGQSNVIPMPGAANAPQQPSFSSAQQ